jgi:predicted Zn-dependent peptidase
MATTNYQSSNQQINRFRLHNGITVIVVENTACNVIAGRIFLKNCGGRWEKRSQAGISHLLAAVMTKGTKNLTGLEIAEKVESIGATLGTDAATDYFLVTLKTIASDFEYILSLVADIIRFPSFPESEVELEKNLTLQNILSQKEQPFNVAFNQLREMMYGDHPYGVSILGKEETVSHLTAADLKQYHQTYFRPDNMVISLAGRLTTDSGIEMVEKCFGNWEKPAKSLPQLNLSILSPQPEQRKINQDIQQSIIMLGYLAAQVSSEDYPVLKLLSTYLGNGLSSRLFVELREKRGLAYDVSCFYPTRLDKSQFVVYMGTAPQNTETGIKGLENEVRRLGDRQLTPEELQITKNKLLGQYALGKQTNAEFAQIYGWYESLGLGIEYDQKFQQKIAQITTKQVQQVASSYLQDFYLSIIGP